MVDLTLPLPGLSPIAGKEVVARFDGGRLSSDGGLLLLREIKRRLAVAERLAACIDDRRDPGSTLHTLADIIRFRLLMIAAGYEDGNDATSLRVDPVFKMALERLPSGRDLCSQSTISRLENLPDIRTLLRLGGALVDLYCGSFRQVPRRITLDIDDTFDAVHGGQQLRLFNAHYDDYGFQPIVVFDADGRFVTTVLRPAEGRRDPRLSPPPGAGDPWQLAAGGDPPPRRWPLRLPGGARLVRGERNRLRVRPRPDQHMEASRRRCGGEHLGPFQGRSERRQGPPLQRVLAAHTWSRVRRIVARVEAGSDGTDTRFIVTTLGHGSGRSLYQDLYCRRGQAENHIKAWKTHLAADRTSCPKATANQFRLFLHAGAYWLLWSLRALTPRASSWRVAQFDTLRLRLIKIAARIVELKTRIKVHLPTSAPDQSILHLVLGRLPRLVT